MTVKTAAADQKNAVRKMYRPGSLRADLKRDKWLYILLIPGLLYFIVFKYLPMFGIVIAFEHYVP